MGRGQADYGQYAVKEVAASISDMGEVAARLGSIVTYDKRGDVVDFDNFEEPILRWGTSALGTDSLVCLDSESVKSGGQSAKLTTDASLSAYASIYKYMPVLGTKKLGLEVSQSVLSSGTYLLICLYLYNGIKKIYAELKLDADTSALYILDSTNTYKEIVSGLSLFTNIFSFSTMKLVVDFDAGYYTRLLFDNAQYDLSSEALYSVPSAVLPRIYTQIWLKNNTTDGGATWIDDIIWTQAEP